MITIAINDLLKKNALRRAIREKCLDCCCGQEHEIRMCPVKKCSLWPYRLNVRTYQNPEDNGIITATE